MLGAIYKGLTGLGAFSKGLENISDNVSNVNTPGYRGKDLIFRDIYDGQKGVGGDQQSGNGVTTTGVMINASQGNFRETGVDTNAAIDGNGYFILEKDGDYYYTRVGRFEFSNGVLISSDNFNTVVGYNQNDQLGNIDVNKYAISPAQPTTKIKVTGNLSRDAESLIVEDVKVIDSLGEVHNLSMEFTSAGSVGQYTVVVKNDDGVVIALEDVRFNGDGAPIENFDSINFTLFNNKGAEQKIIIDFGSTDTQNSATNFPTGNESSLSAVDSDGVERGELLNLNIDLNGDIVATYSNGKQQILYSIALAEIADLTGMQQVGSSLFKTDGNISPFIGRPSSHNYGVLKSGSLEMANVDITDQFTDLVIVQRGYQAASQVLVTANEMLDNLMQSIRGGR